MAKKSSGMFSNKNMAIMLFVAIIINEVLPRVGVSGLGIIALILTLIVAIMLLLR